MRALALVLTVLVASTLAVACDGTGGSASDLPPAPTATESGAPEIHYYRLADCEQCKAYAQELRAHVATHPREVVVRDLPDVSKLLQFHGLQPGVGRSHQCNALSTTWL